MKLLEYKQFNNSNEVRSLNKTKVAAVIIISILILIALTIMISYIANPKFRNFMDKYILFKHVDENDCPYISLEQDEKFYVCAYHNYVAVLENHELKLYNSSGKEVQSFKINISSPIFSIQDNYLVIAEKDQQKCYLIKDKKIIWEKDIEGQISRINVNQNGFVSVIVSGTSYKSVISTFSEDGSEVFKTYLSNTVAVDVDLSKDNKYMSYCEVDLSGAFIESKVKTVSIDKAKQDPANAIIYTYQMPVNALVTNIEYHERDELVCLCDNQIYTLKNGGMNLIADYKDSNTSFVGVDLAKSYFKVNETTYGLNNQNSDVEIYNTSNNKMSKYSVQGIAKKVYAKSGVIAVNLGTEAYFIGENGWLIKKYTSSQEIKDIVMSNNIAGIIYKNKITFVNL
jgi:hypothetical protein